MFKITIEETKIVETKGEDYKIIERRPLTKKEYEDTYLGGFSREEKPEGIAYKDVYGYLDEKKIEHKIERKVLEQEVDNLDLNVVIRAINKL